MELIFILAIIFLLNIKLIIILKLLTVLLSLYQKSLKILTTYKKLLTSNKNLCKTKTIKIMVWKEICSNVMILEDVFINLDSKIMDGFRFPILIVKIVSLWWIHLLVIAMVEAIRLILLNSLRTRLGLPLQMYLPLNPMKIAILSELLFYLL